MATATKEALYEGIDGIIKLHLEKLQILLAEMSSSRSDIVTLSVRVKLYFFFSPKPIEVPIHRSFPIPRRACFIKNLLV